MNTCNSDIKKRTAPAFLLPLLALLFSESCPLRGADTVSIDTNVVHQTIQCWGAPAGLIGNPDALLDPILDELVNGLGVTRLRFEPARREWESPLNDDSDPSQLSSAAFVSTATDERVNKIFLPFKRKIEANGEHFEFYVSPSFFDGGSSGSAPAWLLNSPGEYTEWACAFLQYLRERYNLLADYYSICNEAGNNNSFSASVVAGMIKALAPRLEALGFRTRIEFPECVNADASWSYIQSTQNDPEVWRWVGLVSYHLYGGNNSRTNIRDFALARDLPTAQTEYMGLNLNYLYDDLTLGGVSTWEYYAMNDILTLDTSRSWFSRTQTYWQTRQILRFVRPGAVRVEATSSAAGLRPLAFIQNGATVVILINNNVARSVEVSGITPGTYARSQNIGSNAAQELGLLDVADTPLTLSLPANAILTLYPHTLSNLPPSFTDWRATPSFLKQPASSLTLSASATDPEKEPVSYAWSIVDAPPEANVYLASASAASCMVTGLVAAGRYTFQVAASDGSNLTKRKLPVRVLVGNQAPELLDLHNRIPVTVTLPTSSTTLRCFGRDLEGDALTYRWSVVSQPPGATGALGTPNTNSCLASNLALPGDYVFGIVLRDPTHVVSNILRVPVFPQNRAPVIASVTANPPSLSLPSSTAVLSAATSDADGDPISHWWSVAAAPAGALPMLATPGSNITMVAGLIVPGSYTFKLTAVDRAGSATRNVNVVVNPGSSPAMLALASPNGGEHFTTGQTIHIRWCSFQVAGDVKLELYDGESWSTIVDSTANDGIELWTLPAMNSSGCRIRISAVTGGLSDESDGTFSVSQTTPQLHVLSLPEGVPLLEVEQEPCVANVIQRKWTLQGSAPWETVAGFTNSAQTVLWKDAEASNSASAFYRVQAVSQ